MNLSFGKYFSFYYIKSCRFSNPIQEMATCIFHSTRALFYLLELVNSSTRLPLQHSLLRLPFAELFFPLDECSHVTRLLNAPVHPAIHFLTSSTNEICPVVSPGKRLELPKKAASCSFPSKLNEWSEIAWKDRSKPPHPWAVKRNRRIKKSPANRL